MKKLSLKVFIAVITVFAILLSAACNKDSGLPETAGEFTLRQSYVEVKSGESVQLIAENNSGEIVWASLDETVATVSATGSVTGISIGTTTVFATDGDTTLTCSVKVVDPLTGVARLEINKKSVRIFKGLEYLYEASFKIGAEKIDAEVTWSTSDASVLTVNGTTGAVTGKKTGSAQLIATCVYEGQQYTDSITVTVTDLTEFGIDRESVVITPSGTFVITASGTRMSADGEYVENIPADEFVFSSSDENIVKYNPEEGNFVALAAGSAEAIVSYGGISLSCAVTVLSEDKGVIVNSAADLVRFNGKDVTQDFLLAADIDMGGVPGTSVNNYTDAVISEFTGFKSFSGTFYGNGHEIKNMVLQAPPAGSTDCPSFFGEVKEGAVIKNVEFSAYAVNPYKAAGEMSGHIGRTAFIASTLKGTLENIWLDYTAIGVNMAGGQAGRLNILTYECTSSAVIRNIIMRGVLADMSANAVTSVGSGFTVCNFLQFTFEGQGINVLPAGGAGDIKNYVHVTLPEFSHRFYGYRNGTFGDVADAGAFPETVWDYAWFVDAAEANKNLPRLIDGIDMEVFLT